MELEAEQIHLNLPLADKRPSITSSKFEIRKFSDTAGRKRDLRESRSSKLCFRLSDLLLMMLLVFPLVIGIWRGVWQLMDYYSVLWELDPWLSIALGYSIPMALYLFQEPLKAYIIPRKMHFFPFYLLSRLLLLLHSFGSINQWRGLWQFLDIHTGLEPPSAFASLILGVFFNVIFRTFSNVLAPPLLCTVDEAGMVHDCPLRFKTPPSKKWLYFLDCLFSVVIIQSLTVCCWRGLWNLADWYLYPDDPFMSSMASLVFGYILCIILCVTQPLICDFVCTLKGLVRLTVIDMSYMAGFVGCVFAWRGVWTAYDLFIVFETQTMSEWVTTIVGAVGTVLLGCVSTVVVRGIAIDGDLEEDEAAEWLIPYVSHIRKPVHDVPFPEPWICRYLFTRQKMNCTRKPLDKSQGLEQQRDEAAQPLKKMYNALNSIHPIQNRNLSEFDSGAEQDKLQKSKNHSYQNTRIRLSQIPHIDSSSEDELGARDAMNANPELYESTESVKRLASSQQDVTIVVQKNY